MQDLDVVAPAFVEMAHRIVWCSVASVDAAGRPRSRVLHPIWEWSDGQLIGWIGTGPTPTKRAHLEASPYLSLNYWDSNQDTCVAECRAEWRFDLEMREQVWEAYKAAAPPLGYDPAIIPTWDSPASDSFAVLRLEPWRLRVFPGSVLLAQQGDVLVWQANEA
jgi:hypothetical protein